MIAVIKGDIIASRKIENPESWMNPLKDLLSTWGESPLVWELVWGDSFQVEIADPLQALAKALSIKSLIKSIKPLATNKTTGTIDVRMAIGIGEKTYTSSRIMESNGPAFVYAGDMFEKLRKEKVNLAIQSPWNAFDDEINLYLRLAAAFMDNWSVSSAELMLVVLQNPNLTQAEIGVILGIKQNSVSGRWNRAKISEVQFVLDMFDFKLGKQIE